MVGPSQKNSFWALKKMENEFFSKENENFVRKHCLPFQDAPLCTIWDRLNNYAMNVAIRLIIRLESHESSRMIAHFWEHFFKIISKLQVYYFYDNLVIYNDTMRRFSIFWFFFNFLCLFQNTVKTTGLTVPS